MKKHTKNFLLTGLLAIAFVIFPKPVFPAVIYVDQNASGTDDGSSWIDAFVSLQDALVIATSGDEIWVAQGVYKPVEPVDLNGNGIAEPREAVFFLPSGVALYGGFNGTENMREDRDWFVNLTILSGDIDNNDLNGDGNFIAETSSDVVGNNSYHVVYTESADANTQLDGFIITAGKANIATPVAFDDPNLDGGGWYNRLTPPANSSSPTIVNTVFSGNYAESEGGAYYSSPGAAGATSSSLIENCTFSGNYSNNAGGAVHIGSFSPGSYHPLIINCIFEGNEAYRRGGAIYLVGDHAEIVASHFEDNIVTAIAEDLSTLPGSGGAVSLVSSNAVFTKCMFFTNSATGNPTGAFEGGGGGAVYMSTNEPQTTSLGSSAPRFMGCGFYENSASGNSAAWGGALVYLNDGGILSPTFVNCVFRDNGAQNHGGAVAGFTRVISDPESFTPLLAPEFTNCTFFGNMAGQMGGAIYHSGYMHNGSQVLEAVVINSILWRDAAVSGGNEIHNTGNMLISYSNIAGSGGSGAGWNTSLGTDGGNNIGEDPRFVNAGSPLGADGIPATNDDGLRLTQFSDAVNAGNNLAPGLADISEDYIGALRVLGGTVDMGAYERSGFILPKLDFVWVLNWRGIEPPCVSCPLPWSFLLFREFGFDPHFAWKEPAKFIKSGNSAMISGEIINVVVPEISFKVNLILEKEHDWKTWNRQQGTWFADTKEAKEIAVKDHVNWLFWKLSSKSYIEGTGKMKGVLKVKHHNSKEKTGFQMGMGANAKDSDFGIAGYFDYNGKLEYRGRKLHVKGRGSMNADGDPCEENCEKLFMRADGGKYYSLMKHPSSPDGIKHISKINVYPVPAGEFLILESIVPAVGVSVVKITDASGNVVHTERWDRNQIRLELRLGRLNKGLHIVHVIASNPEDNVIHKIIRK